MELSHERGRKPLLSDRRQKVASSAYRVVYRQRAACGLAHLGRSLPARRFFWLRLQTSSQCLKMRAITLPHTSAGRVPTDAGYRAFVDDLLSARIRRRCTGRHIDNVRDAATKMDDLMEQTSAALSRLTDCLSVVGAPFFARVFGEANFARVHVVSSHAHGRRYRRRPGIQSVGRVCGRRFRR